MMKRCVQLAMARACGSGRRVQSLSVLPRVQCFSTASFSADDIVEVQSADAYTSRGKHAQALPLLRRALEIVEPVPEPVLQIAVRQRLADAYKELFKFEKEEEQRKAVVLHVSEMKDVRGKACSEHVKCLLRLRRNDDAFQMASKYAESMAGTEDYCDAVGMKGIAAMFSSKPTDALPALNEAMQSGGASSHSLLTIHNSLSLYYNFVAKDTESAATAFQAAIASAETLADPLRAIRAYTNAGWIMISNSQFQEAEEVIKKALHLAEKTYGDEHPLVAVSLTQLANNYHHGGEFVTSEALYRSALDYLRHACAEPSPTYSNLLTHQNYIDSMWAFSCLVENLIWNDKARKSEAEAIRKQLTEFLADKPALKPRLRDENQLCLEDWMM